MITQTCGRVVTDKSFHVLTAMASFVLLGQCSREHSDIYPAEPRSRSTHCSSKLNVANFMLHIKTIYSYYDPRYTTRIIHCCEGQMVWWKGNGTGDDTKIGLANAVKWGPASTVTTRSPNGSSSAHCGGGNTRTAHMLSKTEGRNFKSLGLLSWQRTSVTSPATQNAYTISNLLRPANHIMLLLCFHEASRNEDILSA